VEPDFYLLGGLGEDQRLICMHEQDDNIGRKRRTRQRRIDDVLWLGRENGDERQILLGHIAKVGEHLERVHQVGLLFRRRLQIVRVDADRATAVVGSGGCERSGRRILPEPASGGARPLCVGTPVGRESEKDRAMGAVADGGR